MKSLKECAVKGCKGKPKWQPTILLWAMGHARTDHKPAQLLPELAYCESCKPKKDELLEDLFPPSSRQKLREANLSVKMKPFNWASAEVEWKEVNADA